MRGCVGAAMSADGEQVNNKVVLLTRRVESKILVMRGRKVILDLGGAVRREGQTLE
jgi:hypothetical protein